MTGVEYRSKTGATLTPRLVDSVAGIVVYTNNRTDDLHEVSVELFRSLVDVPTLVQCPSCDGSGTEADYVGLEMRCVEAECSHCGGKGTVVPLPPVDLPTPIPTPASEAGDEDEIRTCKRCGLEGRNYNSVWVHIGTSRPRHVFEAAELLPTPPSTEESGEPDTAALDPRRDAHPDYLFSLYMRMAKAHSFNGWEGVTAVYVAEREEMRKRFEGIVVAPASDTADYLRGKLDEDQ